jgi:Predicted periplasmic lipoprotein (DUF2279)
LDHFLYKEHDSTSHDSVEKKGSFLDSLRSFNDWPREKKVIALNLTAVGAMAAMGTVSWDYCSSSFHFQDEGWFNPDTPFGGADKLGHAFSAYALADIYHSIYRSWGYSDEDAMRVGVLSSWSQMTLIEVGDGFSSEYGFSWEDEAMDTIGVGIAYLRQRFPRLKEIVDYRLEWYPSPAFRHGDRSDPFTDYSGQKYLLAFKPEGLLKTDNPVLKAIEVQLGYYSRGYAAGDDNYFSGKHRYIYVALGLNVTYILEQLTGNRAAGIFDYIQVPGTYISSSYKLRE